MMTKLQSSPFAIAYLAQYPQEAAQLLAGADAETIASLLTESTSRLKIEQLGAILIALPSPIGADSLALLANDIAAAVMPTLSAAEIAELVAHLPAATTRRLLSSLRPAGLAAVRRTLSYAPDSVGKRMQTRAAELPEGISVAAARAMLPSGRKDAPAIAFVLDSKRHVRGLVTLHEIAAANDVMSLDTLIRPAPPALKATQRLKEVQKLALWREHQYLPVVSVQDRFIGVLERTDLLEAMVDMSSPANDQETDPIGVLLAIAETVWVPLARLFGAAASPLHPHLRSEAKIHDEPS
jgi:Mg/Co/Ni transporter MgtE